MDVRICVAECHSVLGDKYRNLAAACAAIQAASERGSDIIVFPELFITGYDASLRTSALAELPYPDTDSKNSAGIIAGAAAANQIMTVYGFAEKNTYGKPFNSASLIGRDGRLIGTYRKTHLFGTEDLYFEAGRDYPVFDTPAGRIGMMICYDIEFPEPARNLTRNGAELIIAISANMEPYRTEHKEGIPLRARENSVPVAYSNYYGRDKNNKYCGQSVIVDRNGYDVSAHRYYGHEEDCVVRETERCGVRLIYGDVRIERRII